APPITNAATNNYTGAFGAANGSNVTSLEPNLQDQGFLPASIATGVAGWLMNPGTAPVLALASKYTAVYMQNTFRPTTKWLLTFGIRYDVQPGPTERTNRMSSW